MKISIDDREAESVAEQLVVDRRIDRLPVCPFTIAKDKGIEVQPRESDRPGVSGFLMRVGNQFGILYATHIKNDGFIRFTVCHELGHYFLPGHYLPDRKRILVDATLPAIKQRWGEAHEIGHSIIDWHDLFMHDDDKQTLSPACHAQLEAEANYAAGRLLFLQDRVAAEMHGSPPTIRLIQGLSKTFGNSITTTLWRVVEHLGTPAVGIISGHPRRPNDGFNPADPCRYFIRSRTFERQFGKLGEVEIFAAVRAYCGMRTRGPLGDEELIVRDDNGAEHIFYFETFYNSHDALTLGIYRAPKPVIMPGGRITAA